MKLVPTRPVRRLLSGLTSIALLCAALPLLAPTCGGFAPGVKTFAKGSLIIPMDVCYQCSTDGDSSTSPASCSQTSYVTPSGPGLTGGGVCPQATDPGDVVKAYGLVYQLIRAGIPVYWTIKSGKVSLDDVDFAITYTGGPPVQRYDWSTGGSGTAPTSATSINYRGGPFVVDGTDAANASAVLQANKGTFSGVKVHVSNVAFQADVARTMSGGWTAGGTVPPKLALLDIGSSGAGAKNSEVVIRGYLIQAGLDTVGAGGTSAAGSHGTIYDRLTMADFLPDATGLWTTTNLYKNGYQILWVPHWTAPSSCSDCTTSASTGSGTCPTYTCSCSVKYTATDIASCLKTIGSFYGAGHDVFAECAGLGSFEGVLAGSSPNTTVDAVYGTGDATTHFQTVATGTPATTGVWINYNSNRVSSSATFQPGNFGSPFLQIGDFVFTPRAGAISNFDPTLYNANVKRFLAEPSNTNYDIFTIVPALASGHGTSVYMGGHSYSGCDASFQTAGTRLVLNSLFNLGASCVATGVACTVPGQLGACAQGAMGCDANGNQVCLQTVFPKAEVCNGIDDNCNGLIDENLTTSCYDGPPASLDSTGKPRGICHAGAQSCEKLANGSYAMGACVGEQLPMTETCNGLDDDCNGLVDDLPAQTCYDGPASSIDAATGQPFGICKQGSRTCTSGAWSACTGEVLPNAIELCGSDGTGNGLDDNCNGLVDEGCGCGTSPPRTCYTGMSGTLNVGSCRAGVMTCVSNQWTACVTCSAADAARTCTAADRATTPLPSWCACQVVPAALDCVSANADANCNSVPDATEAGCKVCPSPPQGCYTGAPTTLTVGDPLAPSTGALPVTAKATCHSGTRQCTAGVLGACVNQILPSSEVCDGKDNDCNGIIDDGAACGTGYSCVNGVCVFASCAPEFPCPDGYACSGTNTCTLANCGTTGAPCASGFRCLNGACVDPCASIKCGTGSVCAGGLCTAGSCYSQGCPTGQVCKLGACAPDLCASLTCPGGTFCRDGDCVQACTWVSCAQGQMCGADGFCVANPCSGVTCQSGYTCNAAGTCEKDLCVGISCGTGQYCQAGACIDDPCASIRCPAGICWRGQCYPSTNQHGEGTIAPPAPKSGGCGCGGGADAPALVLLGLLALPLARRRRAAPPRGGGLLVLLAAVGLTGLLAGCPKKSPVDLSGCAATCGEQHCVDVRFDASHCGNCSTACAPGNICVDSTCGPASLVAPYVGSTNPASGTKGAVAPVSIQITGERFQSGATLRVIRSTGVTSVATTFTDAQHVAAQVDISTDPTSTLYLRVVNPGTVISNARPFQIVPATPVVTGWTPNPLVVNSGTVVTLHASGTGLNSTSQCHIASPTTIEQALPSTVSAGGLDCTLDANPTGVPPGTYQLWVQNEGGLTSAKVTLVVGSTPVVMAITPSSALANTTVTLTVDGSGFSPTSVIYFDSTLLATSYVGPTRVVAPTLNLSGFAVGNHSVKVSNGGTDSNVVTFNVGTSPPSVSGISPQTAYQGQSLTLKINGANFTADAVLQVRKPDGTVVALTPTTVTGAGTGTSSASATLTLTPNTSWPTGTYQVFANFPTPAPGTSSSSFPFTVLSNTANLFAANPAGAAAGTTGVTVALSGSNFFSGMKVYLRGAGLGLGGANVSLDVSPTSVTSTSATTAAFSLANFNTGLYQLVAVNPGASDSNTLAFSVTPGLPTLTQINGASPSATIAQSSACATSTPPPTIVTLTGTNFALPDASGSGATQVVTWNPAVWPGTSSTAPIIAPAASVQVVDYTTLKISVDTCNMIPSAAGTNPYTVQVWNAGATPQKSATTLSLYVTP